MPARDRARLSCRAVGLDPARPVVALLPGSRPNEIRRILPRLLAQAAALIAGRVPGVQFLVARAPSLDDAPVRAARDCAGQRAAASPWSTAAADDVLAAADVVVTASGTATVQTALHGRPMVIVYRLSPLTYAHRPRVRAREHVRHGESGGRPAIVPELIQDEFTPEAVARRGCVAAHRRDTRRRRCDGIWPRCASRSADRRVAARAPRPCSTVACRASTRSRARPQ